MKKILILVLSLGLVSCASSVHKEIETEAKGMPEIHGKTDMMNKMYQAIKHSKLTEKQKRIFGKLHHKVWKESQELNSEIRKMKVLLFRSMASEDYNEEKVYRLKRRVKKLYGKKLDLMFNAFVEVQQALGKDGLHFLNSKQIEEIHLKNL